MDFEYKMVIVTRRDLKLSTGKLCAQVGHAAVDCALQAKQHTPKWFTKWKQEGAKKTVVKVGDVDDFFPLKEKAQQLNLVTALITDAGHTEIPPGTKTVLGIGPGPSNIVDQVTGHLSLL